MLAVHEATGGLHPSDVIAARRSICCLDLSLLERAQCLSRSVTGTEQPVQLEFAGRDPGAVRARLIAMDCNLLASTTKRTCSAIG